MTRPLNKSDAGVDLALIQTSLLFLCKSCCCDANEFLFAVRFELKQGLPAASLSFKGLVTEQRTVKRSIYKIYQ